MTNYSASQRAAAELELRRRRANNTVVTGFQPDPHQFDAYYDQSPILLLTGSAGGGKSRLAGEIIHKYLSTHAHATGLMLRKAREFAGKSIVPFMKQTVIKGTAAFKKSDSLFQYPNGSVLYWGGMRDDDQREALRSIGQDGALDIVWIEEANAFTHLDFNEILGRMRGKAGNYRQIILTTNPDAPNHWINQQLILAKKATVYYSSAKDNKHNPAEYVEWLDMLTGILRERLVLGKWVQAEGVIYDNFEPQHNITDEADYNPDWPIVWGVDDGYAKGEGPGSASYHPRVILLAQSTPIGGVNVIAEYVTTNELAEISLANVMAWPYKHPEVAYVDSSAVELRARMYERDIQNSGATHKVSEGIKNVRRLLCDGQGVRLLRIHPRCTHLINEMQSYRYDDQSKSVEVGEPKPMKLDDHSVDALRYACWHLRYGQ